VPRDLILDCSQFDFNHVVADLETIRRYNRQRFEMEQLTAIFYQDAERQVVAGYKDHSHDEFWVRGHLPGMPVLPGVLMCEAAAQLCSYYTTRYELLGPKVVVGFGGLDEVRFRGTVRPGERLVIVAELLKVRVGAMIVCRFQEFARQTLICEGQIRGVPLPTDRLQAADPPEDE
jgi:3-hydroxyacyl-[acyl-carrier-protein] dehydratase